MLFAYYESWSRGLDRGSVAKRELEKHPRLELLRRSGLKIAKGEQTLSAQAAPPVVSDALGGHARQASAETRPGVASIKAGGNWIAWTPSTTLTTSNTT